MTQFTPAENIGVKARNARAAGDHVQRKTLLFAFFKARNFKKAIRNHVVMVKIYYDWKE